MNFEKFLRTPFFAEYLHWLLLVNVSIIKNGRMRVIYFNQSIALKKKAVFNYNPNNRKHGN